MLVLLAVLQFSLPVDSTLLYQAADNQGVPRVVMLAVAWMETRDGVKGNKPRGPGREVCDTVNGCRRVCREIGRMQVNPCIRWPKFPHCERGHLLEYYHNIACGASILRLHYETTGSWVLAIQRYNGSGPAARSYRDKALAYIGVLTLGKDSLTFIRRTLP